MKPSPFDAHVIILPLVIYNRHSVILEKSKSDMKRERKIAPTSSTVLDRIIRVSRRMLCALTFIACASTAPETTAGGTFEQYRQAIIDGNSDDAWRLMTSGAKARVTRQELGMTYNDTGASTVRYGATFTMARGMLTLEHDDGDWRVASSLPTYTSRTTAQEALRTFERSVRLGDWDTVFKLIPPTRRSGLTPNIIHERFMDAGYRRRVERMLRALLSAKQEQISDTRVVMTRGLHRIELIRLTRPGHAPSWFVDDVR